MLTDNQFQSLIKDLENAINFELKGEFNRSRVIARQVSGKAIRLFVSQLKLFPVQSLTPYQTLIDVQNFPEIIFPVKEDLIALTTRVNVDFSFPENLNLTQSAKNIINFVKNFKG